MGIAPTFKLATIRAQLDRAAQALDKSIIQTLSYLGEQCVNLARSLNTYKDQTGNLRNSIGYVVVKNGQVVKSGFKRNSSGKSSTQGLKTGQDLANRLASDLGSGWGLIVVAGMNYALSVESRGLDVLSSAEQLALSELPRLMADLKRSVTANVA